MERIQAGAAGTPPTPTSEAMKREFPIWRLSLRKNHAAAALSCQVQIDRVCNEELRGCSNCRGIDSGTERRVQQEKLNGHPAVKKLIES